MSITYGNKKEVIPQVTEIENLEYTLTSTIFKLTSKEIIKIGIFKQSTPTQIDPLAQFKKIMGQQFQIEEVTINENTKNINSDIKTLLIFDTQVKLQDNQIFALKEYLNNGGRAIFFVDGVWVGENLATTPAEHNLFNLLENYGIKINKNFILSTSAELVNFGSGTMQLLTPYPFWLKTNVFNKNSPYFGNVNLLTFPWTSSLSIVKKDNIQIKELIKSTDKSWSQKEVSNGEFDLNPQNIANPKLTDLKDFPLAIESTTKNTKIIVIASSRFALDQYYNRNSSNLEFVLNSLNELASGGALSGIRSRSISFYPLPDLGDNLKDIFKYLNILLLPIILGLYGIIRLIRRK